MALKYVFNPLSGTFDLVNEIDPLVAIVLVKTAAVTLSGERVVAPRPDGTVEYASSTVRADANRPLWLTLGAAIAGDDVRVLAYGEAVEGSWTWAAGAPIFVGVNGVLTQTPPAAPSDAFIQQVAATTESPTKIFFDPRSPIAF